jgi:quercetin dioxygenase-like cupin family protein
MAEKGNIRNIGQKLLRLRNKKGISLDELSEKTGLKLDYLRKIEDGKDLPPVGDILKISRALTIDPDELLQRGDDKEKELRKKRIQDFAVRESSYLYTVLTPKAKNKHLRAFRITIPPESEHPRINYEHEGEEFIYVLEGVVEVSVGQKKHVLKRNDSLHFDSSIRHSLKNNSRHETVLIVTLYTP